MAMVLANNMPAVNTLNILHKNVGRQEKDMAKLSTGTKINGAGDDTSGYAISERMRAQIRSLDQDIQNVKTGQNIIAVAEGAIQSITSNLRTMKEMCINAMNDHNTDQDRATLQKEYDHRLEMIKDIVAETTYNGKILLDGRYESPPDLKYNDPVQLPMDKDISGSLADPVYNGMKSTTLTFQEMWVYRPSNRRNWPSTSTTTTTTTTGATTPATPSGPATTAGGLVQNTSLQNLASAFSARAGTTTTSNIRNSAGNTSNRAWTSNSGPTTEITLDFTGATRAADGGTPNYPADFHNQGFSILCSGCSQYINIRFDATTTASTYNPNCSTTNYQATEYIIGIQNVTDEASLKAALYDGILNASGRSVQSMTEKYRLRNPSYYQTCQSYAEDQPDSICVDPTHNFRLVRNTSNGEYYFQKKESPWGIGIYDLGTYAADNPISNTTTTTPTPPPTQEPDKDTMALIIHHGPKANQQLKVYINDMGLDALKLTGTGTKTQEYASLSLCYVDYAIEYALNEATRMGAYRSRLEMTEANLVISSENTQSSESTIRDADMAKEITEFTKDNVLMQASQSMLAQANQSSSNILSLLQ